MLCDEGIDLLGFKIYGTPWQPRFFDWAFNADEPELEKRWAAIPDDTDILVLHGPPHGYGDLAPAITGIRNDMEHTGSPALIKRIREIKPQLVIFGHIHSGYGVYEENGIVMSNVSVLNERYQLANKPYRTTLKPRSK
jgi:Icc-related predicted phosphoesterase